MIDPQAFVDGLNKRFKEERSKTQFTLGKLIDKLKSMPADLLMDKLSSPHSYRGYYSDLAFEPTDLKATVEENLELAKSCMGETFTGYKGGEFDMGRNTPVWLAEYGCTGLRIMDIEDDGSITAAKESEDD